LLHQGSIQNIGAFDRFDSAFAQVLSSGCHERSLDNRVTDRAHELAEVKYGADVWLRRR
jgi:hypothetical protein